MRVLRSVPEPEPDLTLEQVEQITAEWVERGILAVIGERGGKPVYQITELGRQMADNGELP